MEERDKLPAEQRRLLAVLFLGVLMAALDVAIVGPALPSIGHTFRVDARSLAWVFTAYVLFNLVGSPLIALSSDIYGRRRLYVLSVGLFTAGSLVVALSSSYSMMLAGRAIQGFGAGGIFPIASAVIGDVFPPERRGRALGFLGMVFGLALLLGPVLGGILLPIGWPWLFLINLPVGALVIAGGLRVLPAVQRAGDGRLDAPGVALLGGGLALLALGLNAIDADRFVGSLVSTPVWPELAGAVLFLALFWRAEQRAAKPLVDLSLLRRRQLLIANLLSAVSGMVEAGLVFVPSMLVAAFGVTPAAASFLLLPAVLSIGGGAPVAGRLLDRYGSRGVVVAGALILGSGLALIRWVTGALPLFIADGVVIGLGLASLIGAPLRYIVLNAAAVEYRAAAQSVNTIFRSIGHLTAGPLIGAIVASHTAGLTGYHLAYTALALAVFAGAAAALGLKRREEERLAAR